LTYLSWFSHVLSDPTAPTIPDDFVSGIELTDSIGGTTYFAMHSRDYTNNRAALRYYSGGVLHTELYRFDVGNTLYAVVNFTSCQVTSPAQTTSTTPPPMKITTPKLLTSVAMFGYGTQAAVYKNTSIVAGVNCDLWEMISGDGLTIDFYFKRPEWVMFGDTSTMQHTPVMIQIFGVKTSLFDLPTQVNTTFLFYQFVAGIPSASEFSIPSVCSITSMTTGRLPPPPPAKGTNSRAATSAAGIVGAIFGFIAGLLAAVGWVDVRARIAASKNPVNDPHHAAIRLTSDDHS